MKNVICLLIGMILFSATLVSQTIIRSNINENTTWNAGGSPYVILMEICIIEEGVTLDIEPNVVVKFGDWRTVLQVDGTINAIGGISSLSPDPQSIVFTSYKDDLHGGDTNGNESADDPAPGDWKSIIITATGSAEFRQCLFLYGGDNFGATMLDIRTDVDTIWNCRFAQSNSNALQVLNASLHMEYSYIETSSGIYIGEYTASVPRSKTVFLCQNHFEVDNTPIALGYGISVDFRLKGNDLVLANTFGVHGNGVNIFGSFGGDNYFESQPDFPFFLNNVQILEGASLTLPPGSILKFGNSSGLLIEGSLWAMGTQDRPIIFTAMSDDSFGGDTNGDGNESSPESRLWGPLSFKGMDSSRLENVIIKYGGEWDPAVYIENSSVLMNRCVFAENGYPAIGIFNASPTIMHSTFSMNGRGIGVNHTGSPIIQQNDFMLTSEGETAVFVESANPNRINVENNYWSSTFGPNEYNTNPESPGERVYGPVDYLPWSDHMINDYLITRPALSITYNNNQITCDQSAEFVFENVLWDFGDGNFSSKHQPSHIYEDPSIPHEVCFSATAEYDVQVRQCQKVDFSTAYNVDQGPQSFTIYPNPAKEWLVIESNMDQRADLVVLLFEIDGKQVGELYSGRLSPGPQHLILSLPDLPSRNYVLGDLGKWWGDNRVVGH